MMRDWKMKLYWRLPVFLQETALSLHSRNLDRLYYGDGYDTWRGNFEQWKNWSSSEAETWQNRQLQSIIEVAATRVPYYRETWRNPDWKSIRSAKDLQRLPLLNKQAIRQNESAFLVEGLRPRSLWLEKTSGTTGTSLRIYWPTTMLSKWRSANDFMVEQATGATRKMPWSMIGGQPVIPGSTSAAPYWRFNRHWRQLYLSSYHISLKTASQYVDAIKHYKSEWATGYGSAIAALAESALAVGLSPLRLRAVVVSGDTLLPGMRQSIERFFQCRCFDHYGQAEGVAMAMECPEGCLHVIPQVGIWEILREDGTPCKPGEVGEIVATSLLNEAMPLIRYRLGDYAAWASNQLCSCGNQQPIITNLEGRVDDYLITLDGRKVGRLSTAMKRSPSIHSAQIVQDRPGHAYLLVRPGEGYHRSHALAVCEDVIERIGSFEFDISEIAEIPKTRTGKTALVIRLSERKDMLSVYKKALGHSVCYVDAA
jgi:phenylacetate-CoA ligase